MNMNNNVEVLKTFTFEWDDPDGWFYRDKKGRGVMLYTSDKKVTFTKISGPDPNYIQLAEMSAQVVNRTNRYHMYTTNGRIWPFKINERTGYSGCRDLFLDLYRKVGNHYVRKCNAAKLHITMYGKVGDFTMYVGDLIELVIVSVAGHDFAYKPGSKTKIPRNAGVHFVYPYRNEILSEEDMDFIPSR